MDLELHDTMGAALVERGIMSPQDVAADRAGLEAQLDGTAPPPGAPDEASAQPASADAKARELAAFGFAPPTAPTEYRLTEHGPMPEGAIVDEAFERATLQGFHAAGLPRSIADQFGRLWYEANTREAAPTDHELRTGKQQALAELSKMWGPDTQRNLQLADRIVDKMAEKQPAIYAMLERTGIGNNTWLIAALYNLAVAQGLKAERSAPCL
jgi:hypothetical protein